MTLSPERHTQHAGTTAGSGLREDGTVKVVIVFESMFGNTAALAGEVMAGLADADAGADIALADVAAAPGQVLLGCDLVVLAAPTHALTLSRPESRAEAVAQGADPAHASTGLREWLTTLEVSMPVESQRPVVAVFDTRVSKARHLPGSAARSVARALRKSGFDVLDRQSFYVDGTTGPLSPGEQARAREWGRGLVRLVEQAQRWDVRRLS